jgi:hypothetical protein
MGFPLTTHPSLPPSHTDIADESSGWFYGTAYDYDDETRMLHVMVPDKMNPTFDGQVLLDYRTVHLIECVDGKSDALFNKIVRDSIIKVRWELDWFEEIPPEEAKPASDGAALKGGRWVPSLARYYIRIANQLLVEDDESGGEKKGFVMITADVNVRLIHCSKGKGQEDFNTLVNDGQVLSTDAARDEAQQPIEPLIDALVSEEKRATTAVPGTKATQVSSSTASSNGKGVSSSSSSSASNGGGGSGGQATGLDSALLNKVLDMARDLKECMQELLEERDRNRTERTKTARAYNAFTLEGNLDAAFTLARQMDEIVAVDEKSKQSKYQDEPDPQNATAEEAWHLVGRIERTLAKAAAAGGSRGEPSSRSKR